MVWDTVSFIHWNLIRDDGETAVHLHRISVDNFTVETSSQVHCKLSAVISNQDSDIIISNEITHLRLASARGTDYGYEGLHDGRTSSKERVPEKRAHERQKIIFASG